MANYYLGKSNSNKKKRSNYIMQSDGTFKLNDPEAMQKETETNRRGYLTSQFLKPLYQAPAIAPTASKGVLPAGYTFDEVLNKLTVLNPNTDEYKAYAGYTGYTDLNEFDKAIQWHSKQNKEASKAGKRPTTLKVETPMFPMPANQTTGSSNLVDAARNLRDQRQQQEENIKSGALISGVEKVETTKDYGKYDIQRQKLQEARNIYALDHKFDLYKHYMENDDFEKKSKYVPTELEGWWDKFTGGSYNLGYGDITYEYINDVDGARDKIKDKKRAYGSDSKNTTTSQEKKGYDKLTKEEIAVYNYIYATEGKKKAQEFLDDMEINLTKRVHDERNASLKKKIDDGGLMTRALYSALSVPESVIGNVTGATGSLKDKIQGKEYNPYGYYKSPTNFTTDTRGYTSAAIERENEWANVGGTNLLSFLYQTGMSVADSTANAALMGNMAGVSMASGAYQQRARELKEAGASESQVQWGGLTAGLAEGVGESISLGKLFKIKDADSVIKAIGKQMVTEGAEEGATEIMNILSDWAIRGKSSDVYRAYQGYIEDGYSDKEATYKTFADMLGQTAWAAAGGALSGGIMGGGMAAITKGQTKLTKNEKRVVTVETEQRISDAEANGKKLSSKEKFDIKHEVESELRKGALSIETIENALGGDDLKKYNAVMKEKENLEKELSALRKAPNTIGNMELYNKAQNQLKKWQGDEWQQLRKQVSKNVSDMTLNDQYLRESYNEKGRRGEAFQADVSKYDKSQQETIQRAINSNILNNTNRTHEFVDMIAKISADKGVLFDFTNNEKLRESGFVLEGKRVNGYVKDGNVTLNIDSEAALERVVGHEITHVLEGTEHYNTLAEAVKAYAKTKGEYQSKYVEIANLYKNVEGANIKQEFTAELIGEYLFKDKEFVNHLSTKNQNLFQKIFHEIKYLVKTATAGSKEEKQLLKVKKLFEEVYRENGKESITRNVTKFSLNVEQYLEHYSEHQRTNWQNSKKIVLYENEAQVLDFIERAKNRENPGQKLYFGIIKDKVAERVKSETGYDIHRYNCALYSDNVRKIFKDHGNEVKEAQRGQRAVEIADFTRIPEIISEAEIIEFAGMYGKQPAIQFKKDGITIVGIISDGALDLYTQTMYVSKKNRSLATAIDEQAPINTPETTRSTASNSSISQNQKNATGNKTQYSLSKENRNIAPIDGRLTYGGDIALEKIAPAQQEVQTNANADQTARTRQLAPLSEKLAEASTDNHPFAPIMTVKERNDVKKENLRMELRRTEEARETTDSLFAKKIESKREEYNNRRDKTTKVAQNLLRQINEMERKRKDALAASEKKIHDLEGQLTKMGSEEFKIAEQRQIKQEGYRTMWEKMLGDTSTWKDKKMGMQYQTNTLKRNLRDIVKDADGKQNLKKADAIYEETQGKYNHNEAKLNREANQIKESFRKLKINGKEDVYIQMLGEYKYNPDCEITPDVIHEFYEKNKTHIDEGKVDKVIEEVRELYDSLYERVNEVLEEQGMRKIGYREGYFPHFTEDKQGWLGKLLNWKTQNNDIPTDIAGLTQNFKPNRSWQSFDKRRTSDSTDYSFKKGLDAYVNGALDWIYHIEDIQKRRALEDVIRYQHSDTGIREQIEKIRASEELDADQMQEQIDLVYKKANNPLNNFVQDLRRGTDTLAGKKALGDRILEGKVNRKVYSVMTNVTNRVSANMVAGSVSSALTNFIPIVQSWSLVNPVSSIKAMKDTIKNYVIDDGTIGMSDFLINRLQQNENLYQTNWDKAGHVVGFMMDTVDNFTSQVVWRSKYSENIKKGMSVEDAVHNADNFAEGLMAGRSRGNMPTVFDEKNPLTKLFTVFQLEVANQYQYMFKDMPQETKLGNVSMKRLVGGYAAMFLGSYVYNALYSKLVGRDAAFDPIRIIEELIRGLTDDEDEKDEKDVLLEFGENVIQELPFVGGLFGGGRIPISSALPFSSAASPVEGVGEFADAISNKNWKKVTEELLNPVFYIAMPMGGGQMRKTWKGLSMFDKALPVSGSYTNSGKLRFPVADTFANRTQAAVFGQYANENAGDYFDGGYQPLNDKRIEEFKELDIPIQEYWKIRSGMKGLKKAEEKAEYIAGLDLPVEKKNILINNALNRKKEIDLTDYDEFGSWKAFDEYIKKQSR